MLFRKKMPRSFAYCTNSTKLDEENYLCMKRGVVIDTGKCRKFEYDPCKRIPSKPKAMDFSKYDEYDFSL